MQAASAVCATSCASTCACGCMGEQLPTCLCTPLYVQAAAWSPSASRYMRPQQPTCLCRLPSILVSACLCKRPANLLPPSSNSQQVSVPLMLLAHTWVVAAAINGACEACFPPARNLRSSFDVASQLSREVRVVQVVRCMSD